MPTQYDLTTDLWQFCATVSGNETYIIPPGYMSCVTDHPVPLSEVVYATDLPVPYV